MATPKEVMMQAGDWMYPVMQIEHGGRLYFKFNFNKKLMAEVKAMAGAKFHAPPSEKFQSTPAPKEVTAITTTNPYGGGDPHKLWSIPITPRNMFQLEFLKGGNPYASYDLPLADLEIKPRVAADGKTYDPYKHQKELVRFFYTRHYCIGAAEMGTGKTLAAIYLMELVDLHPDEEVYYVAPRSALKAVERELRFWKSKVKPIMLTFEGLVREHKLWEQTGRSKAPRILFIDESSRTKTPTAQRSQAVMYLADAVREDWGPEGYVILMSGSPAPKAPTDWWNQCEIACPGFLKEGTWEKFRNRLGLIVEKENTTTGGMFPQLVTWKDDSRKCRICGLTEEEHEIEGAADLDAVSKAHVYVKSDNEVQLLYERLKGLVLVKFKKDCLSELPDKIYRTVRLKPKPDTLRAAKIIAAQAESVATKLVRLRELSDGFQYKEVPDGVVDCERCKGTTRIIEHLEPDADGVSEFGETPDFDKYIPKEVECPECNAGKVPRMVRSVIQVPCPKEDALREILDEHEDIGRLVVYAGFQGSVDRVVQIAQSEKWAVIRADGRGWQVWDQNGANVTSDPLSIFQDRFDVYPRVVFVGQPGAAGMGLTLTASPTIVYYSNDYNAESRIQSEDRIHRPGMDTQKGATIIDLLHLPSDEMVLENLKKKRTLQEMTLTGIEWDNWGDDRLF